MNRRCFIKAGGALVALGSAAGACAREKTRQVGARSRLSNSRVSLAQHPQLQAGKSSVPVLAQTLRRALAGAAGTAGAVEALKGWFRPDDVIGVKLNCLAGQPLSPRPALCDELVRLLGQCGVGPERIIFFERSERDLRHGGFTPRQRGGPLFLGHDSPGAGYEREVEISGQVGSLLSRIVTRRITALISLGVVKDHNLAGVGGAMKNFFGLIHNPNKYHDNNCDPFVADVWSFPVIRRKFRLAILDGVVAQCHGGPGYLPAFTWNLGGVLAATDPVALDRVAWDIIEKERRKRGLPTLAGEKRAPRWLHTAAGRGLGRDDPAAINLVKV